MLNRTSLLFSSTRNGIPSSDDEFTAHDIIAAQLELEGEANAVLPFSFDTCTHALGSIKQPVYSCLSCGNTGVCAGCSIGCHADHNLVELFNRRNFTCDCGTDRMTSVKCTIDNRVNAPKNEDNKYDHNFTGSFCFCGKPYDPLTETQEMYQCLVCEDWMHETCLFSSPLTASSAEEPTRPPPLSPDDFDALICSRCVVGNTALRQLLKVWAGAEHRGVITIDESENVLGRLEQEAAGEEDNAVVAPSSTPMTNKRSSAAEPSSTSRSFKRSKHSASTSRSSLPPSSPPPYSSHSSPSFNTTIACFAPVLSAGASSILEQIEKQGGRCNIFLQEDYQQGWCRCDSCLPLFEQFPYLLTEEEVYTPPLESTINGKSGLELGLEALNQMPRAQAIEGAIAFASLTERLKAYLAPHAARGETISKEMIDEFFQTENDLRRQR